MPVQVSYPLGSLRRLRDARAIPSARYWSSLCANRGLAVFGSALISARQGKLARSYGLIVDDEDIVSSFRPGALVFDFICHSHLAQPSSISSAYFLSMASTARHHLIQTDGGRSSLRRRCRTRALPTQVRLAHARPDRRAYCGRRLANDAPSPRSGSLRTLLLSRRLRSHSTSRRYARSASPISTTACHRRSYQLGQPHALSAGELEGYPRLHPARACLHLLGSRLCETRSASLSPSY